MTPEQREERLLALDDRLAAALLERINSPEASAQDFNAARMYLKERDILGLLRQYEDPGEDSPVFKLAQEIHQEMNELDAAAGA